MKWRSKDQSRFNIFKLPKAWSVLIFEEELLIQAPFEASALSHPRSFDHRSRPETLRTAMATAFFWSNQNDQPPAAGDAGVEQITLQHGVVLRHDGNHHGWVFRALAAFTKFARDVEEFHTKWARDEASRH